MLSTELLLKVFAHLTALADLYAVAFEGLRVALAAFARGD